MGTVSERADGGWLRAGSLVGFLLVWWVTAALIDSPVLPSPLVVAESLWSLARSGELFEHLLVTLLRVLFAFVVAMAIGTALGVAMGRSRQLDNALDGLLIIGLNIPALVTIILCYIWFGLTEAAAVTAVALNKIPNVVVTVREGARAIDRELLEVAAVYRVPPMRTFREVYLPQLYPYLMAAARSGLALIWKIVLVVELLGRSSGVGFKLHTYFQFFDIASILAYTFAFAATILLIEAYLMRPLERRLSGWRT